jgi:hypothetical protein
MKYNIILDSQLTAENLLKYNKVFFTESEIKLFAKTPWIWYTISGEKPEKTPELYLDAGYTAFSTIITLDNTLKKALSTTHSFLGKEITEEDVNIEKKIEKIEKLSAFLGLNAAKIDTKDTVRALYECKMLGFAIAYFCQSKLPDEKYLFKAKSDEERRKKFAGVPESIASENPALAFIKGSYVDYINSNGTTRLPSDIDVPMVINCLTKERYVNILEHSSGVDNIEIFPMIIPLKYMDGYTFFDLDVHEKSEFIAGNETIVLAKNPAKMLRTASNFGLEKIRSLLVNDEKIETLCRSPNVHRKIYSAIRLPELFYMRLKQNNLGHLFYVPESRSLKFHKNLPLNDIKNLLAESSIELSMMNQIFNNYLDNAEQK